jgi:hypothetical protein
MTESAQLHCKESKANGSLMRAVPLALWTYKLQSMKDLAAVVSGDCKLSHPNAAVGEICDNTMMDRLNSALSSEVSADVVYIIAIVHLLHHPGDREVTISFIEYYATDIFAGRLEESVSIQRDA